jgi:Glycosyl hydrolase-like 10
VSFVSRTVFLGFGSVGRTWRQFTNRLIHQPCRWSPTHRRSSVVATVVISALLGQIAPARAGEFAPYCQQSVNTIAQKDTVRIAALKAGRDDKTTRAYQDLISGQARQLQQCRQQNWLKTQAIWIRLYPCDAAPGALEEVLDRIVDRGYNQVYVETFFNGQVLLPPADNPTTWQSMLKASGYERRDLLAEVIQKGHERGLLVSSWMFGLNFGYSYAIRPEKEALLLHNGRGRTSVQTASSPGLGTDLGSVNPDEAFVDPYHYQVRQDYATLLQAVLKRRPDGVLFDYIRYPRQVGTASVATKVQDLWVYGDGSQQAMVQRGLNQKGRLLIQRYLAQGGIRPEDIQEADRQFPQETDPPLWQGRTANPRENQLPIGQRQALLSGELWRFAVAHAMQGVVDFVASAAAPVQQQGIPAAAVFFPDANLPVGRGFDSRLQAWDRFPGSIEFHPMAYGVCGSTDCITNQVRRVVALAPRGTVIKPVLAGIWQQSTSNRPPLEVQMQAIRQAAPQVNSISHFAYSWQEPQSDRDRKQCKARAL